MSVKRFGLFNGDKQLLQGDGNFRKEQRYSKPGGEYVQYFRCL